MRAKADELGFDESAVVLPVVNQALCKVLRRQGRIDGRYVVAGDDNEAPERTNGKHTPKRQPRPWALRGGGQ